MHHVASRAACSDSDGRCRVRSPIEEGFAYEVAQEQQLFEDGEAKEGITAFLAKRAPNFA